MADYSKMTTEDFDRLLVEAIDADNTRPSDLLRVPGVYEVLSEHYNDDALELWEAEQIAEADNEDA